MVVFRAFGRLELFTWAKPVEERGQGRAIVRIGKAAGAESTENKGQLSMTVHHDNLLARLADRGIKYAQVKKIVQFDLPPMQVAFARQFGRRKIPEVLRQIERWRGIPEGDSLIPMDLKTPLADWINRIELLVFQTLLEKQLSQIGPWRLELEYLPTAEGKKGKPIYLCPSLRITVIDRKTSDKRQVIVSGEELNDPARASAAYRRALEKLGLWDLILRQPRGRLPVSARRPQGWPLFTHQVIPRLYELMRPQYEKPGHYSRDRDPGTGQVRRAGLYPLELLKDMLGILRAEHPTYFAQTTTDQLKAVLQRYLARSTDSTKQAG